MPAAAAIDWSLPGTRIGDRAVPLKPKTIARIEAGLKRYARPITLEATKALACPPMMVPAGGTWREDATSVAEPMAARTARENDGLAVPPFITVHRGADGDVRTGDISDALPSVTASGNHLGLAVPPFIAVMRQNCDTSAITDPLGTVTTSGLNHALAMPPDWAMIMRSNTARGDQGQMSTPASEPLRTLAAAGHQSLITWEHLAHLLMPYYGTGVARTAAEPVGAITATDRWALASSAVSVEDVLFRMLEPGEIGAAMAFASSYQVLGSKREKVRQYGNAVTPPVAEVIISALVECISGEELERAA
jgi:DNA (cytosine-5)-methyltransferase 1